MSSRVYPTASKSIKLMGVLRRTRINNGSRNNSGMILGYPHLMTIVSNLEWKEAVYLLYMLTKYYLIPRATLEL